MEYHIPIRPYGPIDALNRRAAAVGSGGYAMAAGRADYNGHPVSVTWNEYRQYYIAQYFWAGRPVLARGEFGPCMDAAIREYDRGALGASVVVVPRDGDTAAEAICEACHCLVPGLFPDGFPSWYSWKHAWAVRCARDSAHPCGLVLLFDWTLMEASETQEQYEAVLKEAYGRTTA